MKMPDIEDVRELASYILVGNREKEDFKEQVIVGDLEPENEEVVIKMVEDYMSVEEAIESFDDEELEGFALVFGTSHPYPTALRIMANLKQQLDISVAKEVTEAAKEAYERNTKQ